MHVPPEVDPKRMQTSGPTQTLDLALQQTIMPQTHVYRVVAGRSMTTVSILICAVLLILKLGPSSETSEQQARSGGAAAHQSQGENAMLSQLPPP